MSSKPSAKRFRLMQLRWAILGYSGVLVLILGAVARLVPVAAIGAVMIVAALVGVFATAWFAWRSQGKESR